MSENLPCPSLLRPLVSPDASVVPSRPLSSLTAGGHVFSQGEHPFLPLPLPSEFSLDRKTSNCWSTNPEDPRFPNLDPPNSLACHATAPAVDAHTAYGSSVWVGNEGRHSGNSCFAPAAGTGQTPFSKEACANPASVPWGNLAGPQLVPQPQADNLVLRTGGIWVTPFCLQGHVSFEECDPLLGLTVDFGHLSPDESSAARRSKSSHTQSRVSQDAPDPSNSLLSLSAGGDCTAFRVPPWERSYAGSLLSLIHI